MKINLNDRSWQPQCIERVLNENCLINAAPGAGKSAVIKWHAIHIKGKVIITVPEISIALGFTDCDLQLNGEVKKFHRLDLASQRVSKKKTDDLVKWLKNGKPGICVVTHSLLCRVFGENKNLFKKVYLWVDEAHHSSFDEEESNCLGRAFDFCHKKGLGGSLATATPFRTDGLKLFSSEHKLVTYSLGYDKYLTDIAKWTKQFHWDMVHYTGDYFAAVKKEFLKNPSKKTIFYIPHTSHASSAKKRREEGQHLINELGKVVSHTDIYYVVKIKGKEFKIVDLNDGENIKAKLLFIKNSTEVHHIIAMGRCKEGFDYAQIQQAYIIGARNSIADIVQMAGRAMRDLKGKKIAYIKMFLLALKDSNDVRDAYNNHMKSVLATMAAIDIYDPVSLPKDKREGGGTGGGMNALVRVVGEENYQDALGVIQEEVMKIQVEDEDLSKSEFMKELTGRMPGIIEGYDCDYEEEDCEAITRFVTRLMYSITEKKHGVGIEELDFDAIKDSPGKLWMNYTTGIFGKRGWNGFKKAVGDSRENWNGAKWEKWLKENTNFKLIGEYVNIQTKTEHQCLTCNHRWSPTPHDIKRGSGCPSCAGLVKGTTESYKEWLKENKPTIRLVGEYVNNNTKTEHQCLTCNHHWIPTPHNIKRGSVCPSCSGNIKETTESYKEWLKENTNFKLIGEYVNMHTKTEHQCLTCNHHWIPSPTHIKRGSGCPSCSGKVKGTTESYKEWLKENKPTIRLVGEYVSNKTKTEHQCLTCNHHWSPKPNSIKSGRGCPNCYKLSLRKS